jgi:hypothetical protein
MTDTTIPTLVGEAIGKHVLHRTMWTTLERIVVAETEYEVKIKNRSWPFSSYRWVSRVGTREVGT